MQASPYVYHKQLYHLHKLEQFLQLLIEHDVHYLYIYLQFYPDNYYFIHN